MIYLPSFLAIERRSVAFLDLSLDVWYTIDKLAGDTGNDGDGERNDNFYD